MAYPRTIRNFNAFVDGTGYFGKCTEAKLPELKLKTAPHRGAGMDAPLAIDMGMEAMQAEATFAEWSPEHWKRFGSKLRMTLRPAAVGEDDFNADAFAFEIGGRVAGVMGDDMKAGPEAMLKVSWEVDYFRVVINGEVVVEIDVENGKRIIDGVDQLASIRSAMGL